MDKELITQKFVAKLSTLPKPKEASGLSKLKQLANRLEETPELMNAITPILNEILKEENLDLGKEDQNELLEYLQPTLVKAIQDQVLGR